LCLVSLEPPGNHYLRVSKKSNNIPALAVQCAEKAVFSASKGEKRHGSNNTDIDPDIPGVHIMLKLP
jgi:hypothetical protein